jgi:hypothetical protein
VKVAREGLSDEETLRLQIAPTADASPNPPAIKSPFRRIAETGAVYFALVFGIGFLLGTVRVLWLVPRVGTRAAELAEMPFMLIATVLAAHWTIRRFDVPPVRSTRIGVGLVALALLLGAELAVSVGLRGESISEFITARDPVSGTVYFVMLGVFAAMPSLVRQKSAP